MLQMPLVGHVGATSYASLVWSWGCCGGRQLCGAVEIFRERVYQCATIDVCRKRALSAKSHVTWSRGRTRRESCWSQDSFQSMSFDRSVFENVSSFILQSKSVWYVLFGAVWRNTFVILRERTKLMSWSCVMRVGLVKNWGNDSLDTGRFKGSR